MFKNVGKKIKLMSVLLLIAGILVSIYVGVFGHMMNDMAFSSDLDEIIMGAVIVISGTIASIIASLMVDGFGVIVENAEMTDEIRSLLVDIKDKKIEVKTSDNKRSTSILNSNFNNEVFNDKDFSAEEPQAPEYVNPVEGNGVSGGRFVPPSYAGNGQRRPTRPVINRQEPGEPPTEAIHPEADPEPVHEQPVVKEHPVREQPVARVRRIEPHVEPKPVEEPVMPRPSFRQPSPSAPIMSAFDEPIFDEPVQKPEPVHAEPVHEEPVPARAYNGPAFSGRQYTHPTYQEPVQQPAYQEPVQQFANHDFIDPDFDDVPGVYESPEVPAPRVLTPEEQARANQIQDLIFKFVLRRNGKVNINDILRTVPRNIEPSEFSQAVKDLEDQGKLVKNEVGDYTAIK